VPCTDPAAGDACGWPAHVCTTRPHRRRCARAAGRRQAPGNAGSARRRDGAPGVDDRMGQGARARAMKPGTLTLSCSAGRQTQKTCGGAARSPCCGPLLGTALAWTELVAVSDSAAACGECCGGRWACGERCGGRWAWERVTSRGGVCRPSNMMVRSHDHQQAGLPQTCCEHRACCGRGAAHGCVCYGRALMARSKGRGMRGGAQRAAGRCVCGAHSTPGHGGGCPAAEAVCRVA